MPGKLLEPCLREVFNWPHSLDGGFTGLHVWNLNSTLRSVRPWMGKTSRRKPGIGNHPLWKNIILGKCRKCAAQQGAGQYFLLLCLRSPFPHFCASLGCAWCVLYLASLHLYATKNLILLMIKYMLIKSLDSRHSWLCKLGWLTLLESGLTLKIRNFGKKWSRPSSNDDSKSRIGKN